MRNPKLLVQKNGDLVFTSLELPFYEVLQELPSLLKAAGTDPRSRKRLLPDAYESEEDNEDWRKHATPDTEHLFCSARDLVELDILQMKRDPLRPATWQLFISASHHTAWMTSLNAARLALGEIYRITESDMDGARVFDSASERDAAILKIRLLAWLEELLVLATEG
ncbi:MAG: DUF2017 family protein [Planctomycetota bacterium]